ncbi:metal-dependent phosphohydrolase [Microcoleus sp. FACHB-1515]|uniref:DICT sensory domain-containing protein n=1 Tax=Cyanophyceae TaxID=3028117 RepID=UPI0016856DF3|nr:DICT sensory domain-containing protein [Microcoleus sp. FACHB-1515]MBD2089805.1 metal-dependent phosphohydrolase [Microcoleus sp. FACHB-1515]
MLPGSILQKLKSAHTDQPGKRPLNFGVYYKNTLVALCHALEDAILAEKHPALMITAFQRGKWYLQEADRYGEIADQAEQIVILAAPDAGFLEHPTSLRSNVSVVSLNPDDPVAVEWHLIIVSPDYTAMVLCQELSEADYGASGFPEDDLERKFYGFWTFEPSLVVETARLAIDHAAPYNPELHRQVSDRLNQIETELQSDSALCHQPKADNLGDVVMRVVSYLRTSEEEHTSHSLDTNLVSNELQAFLRVAQLIDQADVSNPNAAAEVASLAETIGQLLDLPAWQLHRLRLAGLLHRMAFLQQRSELQPETHRYSDDAPSVPLTCPLVPGTQVLRTMQRLRAIATIVTHQTEWWNGSGQPAGLGGDEIPIESRILGLASTFQQELAQRRMADGDSPEALAAALSVCQSQQGDRFDPKLVEALALLVSGLQQGLSLEVVVPKIAAGLWLLDSRSDEDLLSEVSTAMGR